MSIGQAVQVATIEDGTQINFIVAAGRLYRVGTDLATKEDVTPGNVTIDASARVYLTPFSNRLVVQDDVNTPWVASDLLATPVVGRKIDYSGNGSAWKAYGPARVWQGAIEFVVRERDGEGDEAGTPNRRTTRWAWSEPDDPFRGYKQLNYGPDNETFDNEWDMVEASADPMYALWPTNLANYYLRDGSIGYVTGTIGPDLRTTATHDAVEEATGTRSPASIIAFGNTVYFVDVEGRPTALKIGGGTTGIWRQLRRVVDEALTRFPDITARTACAALVPELDLYLVAIWSPDPTNAALVFPTTMYAFRAESGTYVGEWTMGPLDGDKVAVHAIGTLIGANGEPRLVVLGKPSLAADDDPVGVYAGFSLDDEIWHDDDELPDILITTNRIGYSADTLTNVDQVTVIVKTVPEPADDDDDEEDTVPRTITIAPATLSLAVDETRQLAAVVRNPAGNVLTGVVVSWHSDNESAATVGPTGIVTRRAGAGTAHIFASSGNITSNACSVAASTPDLSRVPASVSISPATATLTAGETVQLSAVVRNNVGAVLLGVPITWASNAAGIVAVSTTGAATGGLSFGSAGITATAGAITSSAATLNTVPTTIPVPTSLRVTPSSIVPRAGSVIQVSARPLDFAGNVMAIAGIVVTWSATGAGGVFAFATSTTDSTGLAQVAFMVANDDAVNHVVTGTAGTLVGSTANIDVQPAVIDVIGQSVVTVDLPQIFIDSDVADTPSNGSVITVGMGDSVQAAWDAAVPGDVIELQSGAEFPITGLSMLTPKSGGIAGEYITFRPTGTTPAEHTRMTAALAASNTAPKLVAMSAADAITIGNAVTKVRFIGIELTVHSSVPSMNAMISVGIGETVATNQPSHIFFDRMYVHGHAALELRRALALNDRHSGFIDGSIKDIHSTGFDTQAIQGHNGPGPYKITNNYLEASTEVFVLGGADPVLVGNNPSDVEFRYNHVARPMSYKGGSWLIKNLIEIKAGIRLLFEGNVIENSWPQGQHGEAFVLWSVNQSNTNPTAESSHITIRKNLIRNCGSAFWLSDGYHDETGVRRTCVPLHHVAMSNNLLLGLSNPAVSGGAFGLLLQTALDAISYEHNTGFISEGAFYEIVKSGAGMTHHVVRNNVMGGGSYPLYLLPASFADVAPGGTFTGNVVMGELAEYFAGFFGFPTGNFYPVSPANVGLVGGAGVAFDPDADPADFELDASSPYKAAATDGTDPGCDIAAVQAAIFGVVQEVA